MFGHGKEVEDDKSYDGYFENGKRHGPGKLVVGGKTKYYNYTRGAEKEIQEEEYEKLVKEQSKRRKD